MKTRFAALILAGGLVATACGSSGETENAKACTMLKEAAGEDANIYDDLYELNITDPLRSDLETMEAGGDDLFEAAGRVMGYCAQEGVNLAGAAR